MEIFGEPPEVAHEAMGNDAEQWVQQACALREAAEHVCAGVGEPPSSDAGIDCIWTWVSVYDVGRMLRGMGLECLIKALWLADGGVLVRGGSFVNVPNAGPHDLYGMLNQISAAAAPNLTVEEEKQLARFSFAINSARYPISKSPGGGYPGAPAKRSKIQWNRMLLEEDTTLFASTWAKISQAIDAAERRA